MPTFSPDPEGKLSDYQRKAIADHIKMDVDEWCVKEFTDEHRTHLGASVIGHECSRFIWYAFRWVKSIVFDGRMLRLFNRGHLEEARFISYLQGIGCKVWTIDETTGKQFRIHAVQGHYGGSKDGAGILPYIPDLPMLLEFKTHNYKSFSHLLNKGSIQIAKPQHFAQMCSYGKHYNFKYALYCAVNKNDDDLYFEIVELDWSLADMLIGKGASIIYAEVPPAKLSENPTYFECKWCSYHDICHEGAKIEKNCRSCKQAVPIEQGQWACRKYGPIPPEFIKQGCAEHEPIVN